MKKVLLLSHSQKSGGAERCLADAATGLRKRGYDVYVFMPSDGELNDIMRSQNISTFVTPYPYWVHKNGLSFLGKIKSFGSIVKYSFKLFPIIKTLNPDVVLSNTLCIPCGALVCKMLKKKHVWFLHEFGREDHKLIFDFGFYLSSVIMDLTSMKILANSDLVRSKFLKYIKNSKLSVVNLNVAKPFINSTVLNFNATTFDLVMVGQISDTKNQLDALNALNILLKEGYNTRLILIGQIADEEYYLMILKFIKDNDLEKQVLIYSHSFFPYSILNRFTIGLMCSPFEALGRVTIEYMKAGIPVIGAKAGSTFKLIDDGHTGLLYELKNYKDLAQKVKQLISNELLIKQIISSARLYAEENYNEENFITGITTAFEKK